MITETDRIKVRLAIPERVEVPEDLDSKPDEDSRQAKLNQIENRILQTAPDQLKKPERVGLLLRDRKLGADIAKLDAYDREIIRQELKTIGFTSKQLNLFLVDPDEQPTKEESYDWNDLLKDAPADTWAKLSWKILNAHYYRPKIVVGTDLEDETEKLIRAVGASPDIFVRLGQLCRVSEKIDKYDNNYFGFDSLSFDSFYTQTTKIVEWVSHKKGDGKECSVLPPSAVVRSASHNPSMIVRSCDR